MGACSPAPILSEAVEKRVLEEIVHPLVRGMAAEGMPYTGVLYAGLMIDASGAPRVVEFNVRFGDPETQALVVRMEGDLVPLLDGAARGRLDAAPLGWQDAADWQANLTLLKETGAVSEIKPLSAYYTNDYLQ